MNMLNFKKLFSYLVGLTSALILYYLFSLAINKNPTVSRVINDITNSIVFKEKSSITSSFDTIEHNRLYQKITEKDIKDLQRISNGQGERERNQQKKSNIFPCLVNDNSPSHRCVRTVRTEFLSETAHNSTCVKYRNAENILICIHDPKIDLFVSASLNARGEWEGTLVNEFFLALARTNVTDVLDIGCNVGAYTLKAAKLGKRVVSLDANIENLRLLSRSLSLGEIANRVTLIYNAISDVYTNVSLTQAPKNIGARQVRPADGNSSVLVETILLDDLENLFHGKSVGIKMDVEGSELVALKGGKSFMKNINVRFIQMEMNFHRNKPSGTEIVSLLSSYDFKPYRRCTFVGDLTGVPVKQWPFDVCFKK